MAEEKADIIASIRNGLTPIHPEGWLFISIFAVTSLVLGLLYTPLGWIGLVLTLWCVYFFRDPPRVTPQREGLLVSPGDGLVQKITRAVPPLELRMGSGERTRISIFLNVFDVHVNRIPIEGTVSVLHYHPGKFLNASLDKASEDNERQLIRVTTAGEVDIGVVQIAGLIARRIVCNLRENQPVKTGEKFGIIRFGSRVDVYLPDNVHTLVIEGQRVIGGETVIADLTNSEVSRVGLKH